MTTDRKHKKTTRARAAADGVSYLAARRAETGPAASALPAHALSHEVAELFWAHGWPVVVEQCPQFGQRLLYAGPVSVAITDPALDPDEMLSAAEELPEPAVPAGEISLIAPTLEARPGGFGQELAPGATAEQIVAAAADGLARARSAALAAAPAEQECAICGEWFPARHLLEPTPSEELLACPACVFDGDLTVFYADPPGLAFQLDQLLDSDLSVPAAWAAVATLLAVGAGEGLHERLERAWRDAGTVFLPVERWIDADHNWIWLPEPRRRPGWMTSFGPGARPSALSRPSTLRTRSCARSSRPSCAPTTSTRSTRSTTRTPNRQPNPSPTRTPSPSGGASRSPMPWR